ncbi:MAG: transposase [Candidatus Sumerlaeota bacterium]|nr:transposase [Candidatus Sumerlaeota bacterium]
MAQSLVQIYVHMNFSTKNRAPSLTDKALKERMHAYIAGICRNQDSPSLLVGGTADHIHGLVLLTKLDGVAKVIREVKRESSKWVKQQPGAPLRFYWQQGYGAFSISPSHVEPLKRYISNQESHHQKESFQDEFRRFLKKYKIEYDER